jgi:signal transduction histidine kinase
LHDETGQALTAIGLGLRGAATVLRQDSDKAGQHLRELEGLAERSLNELQRVITDLRPSHLDDLGLAAALRWYAEEVQGRAPIEVAVEVTGEARELPSVVSTALFRVAQEALTNVVRHSRASYAIVVLEFTSDGVRLRVEDNGSGFDIASLRNSARPSWGLLGMEERAHLLGGTMKVESSPGGGTTIDVTVPYPRDAEVRNDDSAASR